MWKALENDVFGRMKGEIFDAPLHAIQAHLDKGEVEEIKEEIIKEPLADAKEVGEAYEEKFKAPKAKGRPKGWKPGQKYTPQS